MDMCLIKRLTEARKRRYAEKESTILRRYKIGLRPEEGSWILFAYDPNDGGGPETQFLYLKTPEDVRRHIDRLLVEGDVPQKEADIIYRWVCGKIGLSPDR